MKFNPETSQDAYKIGHFQQYAPGVELVFSNMTPRKSYRKDKVNGIVFFGLQYLIKEYLINQWVENFFKQPKEKVLKRFARRINNYLGPNSVGTKHISDLHDLGYLPIKIMSLPEGVLVPYKVPAFILFNTKKEFFWITNYLETLISVTVWPLATTATSAKQFKDVITEYAVKTSDNLDIIPFSGHNFSYRGCMGHEAACMIDAGWLTSFVGSDTVPGADFVEEYYNANSDMELVSSSCAASEHSISSSYGIDNELEYIRRLIEDVYPNGIVSLVADTFDYWKFVTEYVLLFKEKILARDGKVCVRPDSGNNIQVIAGYTKEEVELAKSQGIIVPDHEIKGTIECLYDIFGGKINSKGYKELNPKIGALIGDGCNLSVLIQICIRLEKKGFASTNVIYGVGSFSLVYGNSRDTDGWAVKSTYCEVNGVPREIFKDPKTDKGGLKKSAKGLTAVFKDANGKFYLKDQATWEEVNNCELIPVFENGKLLKDYTLSEVRANLSKY